MDNFFDALKRFVEANCDRDDRQMLYFVWNETTKIEYSVAEEIANTLEVYEINDHFSRERIEELEDHNRLLRAENKILRGGR